MYIHLYIILYTKCYEELTQARPNKELGNYTWDIKELIIDRTNNNNIIIAANEI